MKNKYFLKAQKDLKDLYQVDVLNDILMSHKDRVILYGNIVSKEITLHVISGNLNYLEIDDKDTMKLAYFIDHLDLNNKYAEVSGVDEYKNQIIKELYNFDTETNITIPLLVNDKRKWVRIHITDVDTHKEIKAFHITDVTKYLGSEESIFEKTHKDSLTHLFNKYTLDYHYGARYRFDDFHVMYLDLDDFKKINDKCGHAIGNEFLVSFAEILKSHEENYNRFYRIGGDEFVGFFFKKESEVIEIATDIIMRTAKYKHPNCKHSVSVSIGICQATTREDVIRKADKVLYDVKENGKNHFRYKKEDEIKIGR